jgi:hypothetical protein
VGGVNPYVFIVGCPRSGTTLLRRIADAHPELAITRETHWIPELFRRRVGVSEDGLVTSDLPPALLEHPKFATLQIGREELERLVADGGEMSYAELVSAIFDRYGRLRGKAHVGDKTPRYVCEIATLHALWPAARFVHLIRDGRDVCLSTLDWRRKADDFARRFRTWREDPVMTAALWWRWHVAAGRGQGRLLGPGLYHELLYEALVADPVGECRRLSAFLGLCYDERMLAFHEGRTRSDANLDAKHAWLPVTQGLRDWRTQMTRESVERFEAAAGDLLEELGYARACPVDPALREHAAAVRSLAAADLATSGELAPEGG